jgi:hypothetical protein
VTIGFQLAADPRCRIGVVGVVDLYALAILYFAAYGRRETEFSSMPARF